ncbi:PucR family transcriptional regulator [Mycolicibacterium sp.]|uniref:PucR family transcriptional regulator n=1 Tax=Mycolicibacterium sp. TaxID=2320850 RepID=UPI003D0F4D18
MTVQELVAAIGEQLPTSVMLVDRDLKVLAYSTQAENADECRVRAILSRACSPETRTWFRQGGYSRATKPFQLGPIPALGSGARWCMPTLSPNGEVNGYLFLAPDPGVDIDLLDPAVASRYSDSIGSELAVAEHHRSVAALSLQRLIKGHNEDWHSVAEDLRRAGAVDPDEPLLTLAVTTSSVAQYRPDIHAIGNGGYTLVVTNTSLDSARQGVALARDLTRRGGAVGIGTAIPGLSEVAGLRASARRAQLSLCVAEVDDKHAPIAEWARLGLYRLALQPEVLRDVVAADSAQRLLDHRNPDLWQTALCFLDKAGDVSATASLLQVHRQTLYYRLSRINEIAGIDLSDGDDRLALHLGLKLGRVRERLASTE